MAQKPKKSLLRPQSKEDTFEKITSRIKVLREELGMFDDFRASGKRDNLKILGQYIGRGFSFKEGGSPETNKQRAERQKLRRSKEKELDMLLNKVDKFPDPDAGKFP
tara:strand:+ start:15 stop:335 length:321 start_codon:yes stop_codon:yes gene_type:complete